MILVSSFFSLFLSPTTKILLGLNYYNFEKKTSVMATRFVFGDLLPASFGLPLNPRRTQTHNY